MDIKTKARLIPLLGYASGLAGVNLECGEGPLRLQQSQALAKLQRFRWEAMLKPALPAQGLNTELRKRALEQLCEALALKTAMLTQQKEFFLVFGGDHSSAVGTWSGVSKALEPQGSLGLIWIDAHMDSHVPETSESGRYHGMPLAALLGYGDTFFTQLLSPSAKIKPQQLCLIGVRSYESGEAEFLKQQQVRVFFMEEVEQRGLAAVFEEALALVKRGTAAYGLSIDVDSIDPLEAPGVDVPEPKGLKAKELCQVLKQVAGDPKLIAAEIAEFNPSRDVAGKTEKVIIQLIEALTGIE